MGNLTCGSMRKGPHWTVLTYKRIIGGGASIEVDANIHQSRAGSPFWVAGCRHLFHVVPYARAHPCLAQTLLGSLLGAIGTPARNKWQPYFFDPEAAAVASRLVRRD